MLLPILTEDIERIRPLEALAGAATVPAVGEYLARQVEPDARDGFEHDFGMLAAYLSSASWERASEAVVRLERMLPTPELRDAMTLAVAIGNGPGAAEIIARHYALLAIGLSRWVAKEGWTMTTPAQQAVLRRVRLRVQTAQGLSIGWSGIAEDVGIHDVFAPAAITADHIGIEVRAATTTPTSLSMDEVADDQSWRERLSGLYGHLGGESGHLTFECAGGWRHLLEDLLRDIDATLSTEDREVFQVSQIKEKYGTLRFYTHAFSDDVERLVEVAERRSAMTCEVCGEPGRVQGKGWVSCRCTQHDDDARKREREARK